MLFRSELLREPNVAAYAAALRACDAVHCHVQHPTMPSVVRQERALADEGAGATVARAVVVRWMLPAGTTYEAAANELEPYDRLRSPDAAVRAEVAEVLRLASPARPGFAVVNNKAEGSAALSVTELAAELGVLVAGYDQVPAPSPEHSP